MIVKYYYPIWSIANVPLPQALTQIKNSGYDGAEIALDATMDLTKIKALFKEIGLELLAQHPFTTGNSFDHYRAAFIENLKSILSIRPIRVNCHTGRDYYTLEQNLTLIEDAILLASEYQIPVTHEIHRGRFSYGPMVITPYLKAVPKIRLTADFSHWCVVSESLLEHHEQILALTAEHCDHIHARVGNEESPQVNDPFTPEHGNALERHVSWWQAIYKFHLNSGTEELPVTCEFGPPPYLQTLPGTREPVASIWDINYKMMNYLKERLK